MRKTKTLDIILADGQKRIVHIAEVRAWDYWKILQNVTSESNTADILDQLLKVGSDLTAEDLWGPKSLYPSQLEMVFEEFKRLNSPLFRAAERAGISAMIAAAIAQSIRPEKSLSAFFSSMRQASTMPENLE